MSACFCVCFFFIYWFSPTRPCTPLPLAFLSICYVVDVVEPRIVFVDFLCTGACYYFFFQSSCYCLVTRCIYLLQLGKRLAFLVARSFAFDKRVAGGL